MADMIGMMGVAMILVAYGLLQLGLLKHRSYRYLFLNLIGAILLLLSLFYHWNLASVIIEIVWILISVIGLAKRYRFNVLSDLKK